MSPARAGSDVGGMDVDAARSFSAKERQRLAKKGQALPDGSYPIVTKQDLRNAIQAYGRASNKAKAKRHIVKRARALGATNLLPDDWAAQDEAATKLYYFEGRNTPIAASSVTEARKKKKRGGDKLVKVRTPTASEKKAMGRGEWVRTRKDGKSPEKSKYGKGRGKGPPRKDSASMGDEMEAAQQEKLDKKRGYKKKKKDNGSLEFACVHCEQRSFLTEKAAEDHALAMHSHSEVRMALSKAIREKFAGPPRIWAYVEDTADDWFVYSLEMPGASDEKLYRQEYTFDGGLATLEGEPVEVRRRMVYEPIGEA